MQSSPFQPTIGLLVLPLVSLTACGGTDPSPPPQTPALHFSAIDAGGGSTCAISVSGDAWCWGNNDGNKLALKDSTATLAWFPSKVRGGLTYTSLSNGYEHTCAVATGGAAYCWGKDAYGGNGAGTELNATVSAPLQVVGGHSWLTITASTTHTCGITTAGAGYCWGEGSVGQLGDSTYGRTPTPSAVAGGHLLTEIVSRGGDVMADMLSCGLDSAGSAWCWGGNQSGQLGNGTIGSGPGANIPSQVSGGLTFSTISAVGGYACGITSTNSLYCWGRGVTTPTLVPGNYSWKTISVGNSHQCGILTSGKAYCWGNNAYGQTGTGPAVGVSVPEPTAVAGSLTFQSISAGRNHTCALTVDGLAYCWGLAEDGLLGIGHLDPGRVTAARFVSPMPVLGPE